MLGNLSQRPRLTATNTLSGPPAPRPPAAGMHTGRSADAPPHRTPGCSYPDNDTTFGVASGERSSLRLSRVTTKVNKVNLPSSASAYTLKSRTDAKPSVVPCSHEHYRGANEENQRLTACVSKISPKVFISFIKSLGPKPNAAVAIEGAMKYRVSLVLMTVLLLRFGFQAIHL